MPRRLLPTFVGSTLLFVILGASGAGAASETIAFDVKTGIATWSAVLTCNPGDDVEIDVIINQGADDAATEVFFVCTEDGEETVFVSTAGEENDRLHPGRAELTVVRTDYDMEGDELVDVTTTESRSQVNLRP